MPIDVLAKEKFYLRKYLNMINPYMFRSNFWSSSVGVQIIIRIKLVELQPYYIRKFDTKHATLKNNLKKQNLSSNRIDFDWDNVEILDEERFYYKRIISVRLFIKTETGSSI